MRYLAIALFLTLSANVYAKLKITSYNIRNFDYDQRSQVPTNKDHLFRTISDISPDLMAVQEINKKHNFTKFINQHFANRYEVALSECGGAHGQKLGFVFDKTKLDLIDFHEDLRTSNPRNQNNSMCNDGSRPLAIGKFKVLDTKEIVIAMSVHLKSGGRPNSIEKRFEQIKIIDKIIEKYRSLGFINFIVMGDFNSTEYIHKGSHYNKFKAAVQEMKLVDLAKDVKCTSYWWGGVEDGKQHPSILDHILVSPALITNNSEAKSQAAAHCQKLRCQSQWEDALGISFDEVSDHCPLVSNI